MRIDAHTHIGPAKNDKTAEQLVELLDWMEFDMACALPMSGLRADPDGMRRNNDYIAEAQGKYPDRILGYCTANPWYRDVAVAEVDRCLGELGMKGFKLHPPMQGFDVGNSELMDPLMERVAHYGVPIIIHCGLRVHDNPWRLGILADHHPSVTVIMAHSNFGGTDREGIKFALERPNILFETSGTPQPKFMAELARASNGRVVFGTDWPAIMAEVELKKVYTCPVDEALRQRIMGGRLAEVFGLGAN